MAEPSSPAPPPATPAPPAVAPRRGRALRSLAFSFTHYLLGLTAVAALVVGAFWWLLYTESGAQWLLPRIPGLQVSGISGRLLGPFTAQRVELPLPTLGAGAGLRLQELSWSPLRLRAAGGTQWLRVELDELRASRVDLSLSNEPSSDSEPPQNLELSLGLDIASLHIDALHVAGIDTPVRQLHARLRLGAEGGSKHVLDTLQLAWDRLKLDGRAQVATRDGLAVDAALKLTQQPAGDGDWQATLLLAGPLATPQLQATLRAQAAPSRPAQTLDLSATLRPFAAWPLGDLQASARALDLSALHSDAPRTALDLDAAARTLGLDQPAELKLSLNNREAGRWNERRLPLRKLDLQLSARPDDPSRLDIQAFEAELGSARAAAGRISGSGQWNPADWRFDARLSALRPTLLDARAPDMRLDGRLQLDGSGFDGSTPQSAQIDVRGNLDGQLLSRGPAQPVQVRLDVRLNMLRIELRELLARSGNARATVNGRLTRASPAAGWAARGQATLQDFDPLPWWPGPEDSPWRQGPHRLNAEADFDLALPASASSAMQALSRLRGRVQLGLQPSRLAGVPLSGSLSLQTAAAGQTSGQLLLDADGNRLRADARLDGLAEGSADHWELKAEMPTLKKLQPLWKLLLGAGSDARLDGNLQAEARIDGRWPALSTQGRLDASALQFGALQIKHADARWTLGTRDDAPLDAQVELGPLNLGAPSAETVKLQLKGTLASHTLQLQAESKALPPAWVEAMQDAPAGTNAKRTQAQLRLQGGALGSAASGLKGWRGKVQKLEVRGDAAAAPAWLQLAEFGLELQWADGPLRLKTDAGRAELLGAALSWSRIAWAAADPGRAPARLDAQARLEPLDVAPLLKRMQPGFGWGGDLRLSGQLVVQSSPTFSAEVVVERASGDLSVTDDSGTRTLGLTDLRIGLNARDGLWSFSTGLAGQTLGRAAGAVVVRSTPRATWPAADAPMDGVLELQIGDLGVWGPWLPAGWRLTGGMHANAAISGRFGAPTYEGELSGSGIGVRNVLQGVDVRDGEVNITLLGDSARIEKFAASAGKGRLSLRGEASLGASPRAELNLALEQFQLLGRIDRRIVASGDATLKLGRDTLALNGDFKVDEGLIDFSRSEAPRLSDDVQVHRGNAAEFKLVPVNAAQTPAEAAGRARSRWSCACSWARSCASAARAWMPGCAATCA
jgi:translocation and assembly module TamB